MYRAPTPKSHPKLASELRHFAKRLADPKYPTQKEKDAARRLLGRAP